MRVQFGAYGNGGTTPGKSDTLGSMSGPTLLEQPLARELRHEVEAVSRPSGSPG